MTAVGGRGPGRHSAGRGGPGPQGGRGQYGGPARQGGFASAIRRGAAATRVDRVPPGMRPGPGGPGRRGPGGPGGPRRPGYGPRGPVKGSWWRTWTWKKALAVAGGAFGGLVLILAIAGFYMYSSTSIPTQTAANVTKQNSTVYFSDGKTLVGSFGQVHRQLLTYNQIPKIVDDAVMSAEDRGFLTEGAIDPRAMLRAAYDDVTSGGGSLSGGSTITQQFVRNYYDDIGTQQTASRKIKEIFVAMKVSQSKSKQWILMNYLNTIYLGEDSYGVAAAAQTYFGVPVSKLTVAQAAVIAAIIQQPSLYPLPQYRPQLEARWHYVLNGMVTMGDLTAQQAAAMKFPTLLPNGSQFTGAKPWDSYILQEVEQELQDVDHITPQQLDTGGYTIKLTISQQDEQALYTAVNYNISQIKAQGNTLPPYALIGAEEQNPTNGAIEAIYGGPGTNMSQSQCAKVHCAENTTLTPEQVGSSFKPYTLAAAVKEGMNVKTSKLNGNSPLWVPPFGLSSTLSSQKAMPSSSGYHEFTNDAGEQLGTVDVQTALAKSSNTAFTDLAHRVGLTQIEQMAEEMGGVDSSAFKTEQGVGITLGQDSLTVNDQASMVATIDNGGVYHAAHMVAQIIHGGQVTIPKVESSVVLTQAQDSQVQYAMLKTDSSYGTAPAAAMTDGRPIIGKTGTTSGSKSAFFIGAIPQNVLAVGIFTDKQSNTNNPETLEALGGGGFGGSWPAAIWHSFAEARWASDPIQNFLSPVFTGQAWIQVPKAPAKPKPKPKPSQTPGKGKHHGGFPLPTTAPSSSPNPTPSNCSGLFGCSTPTSSPSATTSPSPPVKRRPGG